MKFCRGSRVVQKHSAAILAVYAVFLSLVNAVEVHAVDKSFIDRIVAVVDGEPITAFEIRKGLDERGEPLADSVVPGDAAFKQAVQTYVGHIVLEREAKSLGFVVNEGEIAAYIEEIKKQNRVDEQRFLEMLETRNLTLDDYKKQISFDILRSRIVSHRIRSKVNISDKDIERYLEEHPELNPDRNAVRIAQIFVPYDGDWDAARTTAKEIYEKIDDGDSLEEAGGDYYVDLGYVSVGDLRTELQEVVSKLEIGDVTSPYETDRGIFILKAVERRKGMELPDDLKESVRGQLFQDKFKNEIDDYLNRELPKKYSVEVKPLQ